MKKMFTSYIIGMFIGASLYYTYGRKKPDNHRHFIYPNSFFFIDNK